MGEETLSEPERDLLLRLAAGSTAAQIADETAGSVRHVRLDLRSLRRRLAARNNTHAVVLAIRRGII